MFRCSISVRGLAAIVAACALACVAAASASAAPLVWTANSGENSVSTFNSATHLETGSPIQVGEQPESIAITPDGTRAVVTSFLGNDITVIDTASRTPIATVSLGARHGERVAISPDGKTAYVTDEGDEEVHVLDVETGKLTGAFKVGLEATAVAFEPDGRHAYVGTAPEAVAVVDTATRAVVGKPISVGGFPRSMVFSPDGATAYVTAEGVEGVKVIDTTLGTVVATLSVPGEPRELALSPNGQRLYVSNRSTESVTVISTASGLPVGTPIRVGEEPGEVAFTPDGRTAYVAVYGDEIIRPIETAGGTPGAPIKATGKAVSALVVAPDQSPTAAFTPPGATAGTPAVFGGAASSDPDGTVASWNWAFGDGGTGSGVSATHTYGAPGIYNAKLSVVDNEGCGEAEVFTGRTAYCSGGAASVTHPVTVNAPALPIVAPVPSNKFGIRRVIHNRRNGTVRLQLKLHAAGYLFLFGRKVHAVTRKPKAKGLLWLTVHPRVRLNKRLKKIHRAPVRIRITFTPNGGTARTVHRSLTLLRTKGPRHRHNGRHGRA